MLVTNLKFIKSHYNLKTSKLLYINNLIFLFINLSYSFRFVILGTDGLWDYLPAEEAVQIVKVGIERGEREDAVAMKLVDRALEIAASECQMTLQELKKIPPGRNRRNRHDDTTAVVLYF